MNSLSHVDENGRVRMVDVGSKPIQNRMARASGSIRLNETSRRLIGESLVKKGDVLAAAEIAGIQAAKQTPALIPLCHPLMTDRILVTARLTDEGVTIESEVRCSGRTGAEMEALTAVSVALLTVYDMVKAVDKSMVIDQIRLIEKTKSGEVSR